ncbi:hypothetical protein L210DRAFT_977048 [Boletus edulis BED1]|uniref:Uncharacterized protein n=1 Tax=Boletus edulis BED1 TaxID=1328754 RepID=A0AAD4BNK7_BOLED|nr:hypothetical protein L210DRAFT_977048 [Boletus edulis BED1]
MPAASLAPPIQALPDSPAPKKTRQRQTPALTDQLELLFSELPSAPPTPPPSIHIQSIIDHDHDTISTMPQSGEAEEEHTLSAYGDISLGEIIVPPLPPPTHSNFSPMQQRFPQPRLRLKVQRPPMPKRRLSYTYFPDPLPHTGGLDPDERWPGSPRPFVDNSPWFQHQPLVSPLPVDHTTPQTRGNKPTKNGGSSLEKLVDELIPRSPSIRLSPPGSPTNQLLHLPQETREQKNGVQQGRNISKADGAAKSPLASPTPAPRQDKPKEAPWRTRLPPRLPIPKWDM